MNNNQNPYYNSNFKPYVTPNQEYAPNYETINQPSVPLMSNNILPMEQSYIENILRLNTNKIATVYVSYPDSTEKKDESYHGIIEEAGRDHIILSDPSTGKWYILLMIYLNYVEFDEPINYSPSFSSKN